MQIERAVALRRKVLGEHAAETLASMDALALIYVRETHYAQAEAVYKQVLQARRQYFGEDRSETLEHHDELRVSLLLHGPLPRCGIDAG